MAGEFSYGGQAIIEGVMIRGKTAIASAIRKPDGTIVTKVEAPNSLVQKYRWLNIPLLRGTPALIDSLRIGFRALIYSADMAMEAEGEKPPSKLHYALSFTVAMALSLVIFVLVPSLALQPLKQQHSVVLNLLEGGLKILFFLIYVWAISFSSNIRRIFQYHGAEHMVINAYEAGREISPAGARGFSTIHARCGSAFIMLVLFIAILVHAVAGWPEWYIRLPLRILMLIPIAGISYEMLKLSAKPNTPWLMKALTKPGLWLQGITTRQPTDDQLEVAVASLKAVLQAEQTGITEPVDNVPTPTSEIVTE